MDNIIAEEVVNNSGAVVEAIRLIISGGIGAAIITVIGKFYVDRKLEQVRAGYDKELENLKAKLAQKHTIHKLQFEKEFEICEKLWAALVELKNVCAENIYTLQSDGKLIAAGRKLKQGNLDCLHEKCKTAFKLVENNKPFYADDVFDNALKFAKIAGLLANDLFSARAQASQGKTVNSQEYFDEVNRMMPIINDIEESIRRRIGIIGSAKIVE